MITLRELVPGDVAAVQRIYSGASVTFTRGHPMTIEGATTYVTTAITQARVTPRERWCFGVTAGDDLIGLIKFRDRGAGHATLSYILREDSWGRGYGTAAVRQVIAYAFTTTHLDRLSAKHHPDNPASGRVLAKAGFTRTTVFRGRVDGAPVTYPVYEIHRNRGD
ncbi:GNAT family N-acetyltransferase [Streptomyces noursei]|uniref:GNAT family N-acetyltransferase n=1 Tax=Streptomyces noursei TaxID=1971 RepID=UPI001965CFFF|nr:GNAT family N-acetyltransferase [Streptomyces noursei]QRX90856.1 GNAT family N-acetyltransferase [Streptomyces noursei]